MPNGNALHVHDLVDFVSKKRRQRARMRQCMYKKGESASEQGRKIKLRPLAGVRYTVPETINPMRIDEKLTVRFSCGNVYQNCYISVYFDEEKECFIERDRLLLPVRWKKLN